MFWNGRTLIPLSIAVSMGWILSPEVRLTTASSFGVSTVFAQTAAQSDRLAEADRLMKQAETSDYKEGVKLLQRAVAIYQDLKLPRKEAEAYRELASRFVWVSSR
jgi:hypothetical protein